MNIIISLFVIEKGADSVADEKEALKEVDNILDSWFKAGREDVDDDVPDELPDIVEKPKASSKASSKKETAKASIEEASPKIVEIVDNENDDSNKKKNKKGKNKKKTLGDLPSIGKCHVILYLEHNFLQT